MRRICIILIGLTVASFCATASLYKIKGDNIEFYLGQEDRLKVGQKLSIWRGKQVIGVAQVVFVGSLLSRGKVTWRKDSSLTLSSSDVVSTKPYTPSSKSSKKGKKKKPSPKIKVAPKPLATSGKNTSKAIKKSPPKKSSKHVSQCRIHLIVGKKVLVNCGKKAGLSKGMTLSILKEEKEVAKLLLIKVGLYHSIGTLAKKNGEVAWGFLVKSD